MALDIETFSNATGASSLFKALGHPEVVEPAADLIGRLGKGTVALFDPLDQFRTFAALYDLSGVRFIEAYDQDVTRIGRGLAGIVTRPVTELGSSKADILFVSSFDRPRIDQQICPILRPGQAVECFDTLKLPEAFLTDRRNYLSGLNFATNFAFFRDEGGEHTRIVTANYWAGYGAQSVRLWATLFDGDGRRIATWEDALPGANATVVVDSRAVRERFGLGPFSGQLFLHVIGAAGHDVVKYALDTYGDREEVLSCTHDANAWPSDRFAGLPAPREGERVVLWIQNSHPAPIPADGFGLNLMGDDRIVPLKRPVGPFATEALDVAALFPEARWPQQLEVRAGKHVVRPRYEVLKGNGRSRIAHVNVEREDLKPDPRLAELSRIMGKVFILTAPVMPLERFSTAALPTPMATGQEVLPLKLAVHDADGTEVAMRRLGRIARSQSVAVEIDEVLAEAGASLPSGRGHVELTYDFEAGNEADGWLHAIFRYEDRLSGHAAETSFGSHIFNTPLTYKSEPQSYAGRPPGLSTRLFLRTGPKGTDAFCCLVYPASTPWAPTSDTHLLLTDRTGREVARRDVAIPCGGSHLFSVADTFSAEEIGRAGPDCYVLIRDTTCRLFGYHGLKRSDAAFSLDHMFGF